MQVLLTGAGFLGTTAPFHSDLSLILILISSTLFTIGWRLAVGKHFTAHRWVQTSAAVLNAAVAFSVMIPSFLTHILPTLPSRFLTGDYAITTIHAAIGTIGLLLGLFIVLRANGLMPKALRFKNYKLFMRTSYAIYMLSTVLGVAIYFLVYVFGI